MSKTIPLPSLTLETANELAHSAIETAKDMGVKIHVHVTDHAGDLLAYQRMIGAPLQARQMCEKKACTAANFKVPTDQWAAKVSKKPNVAAGLAQHEKIALIGGGFPIVIDGSTVGAIGIAGALEEQDIQIGKSVIEKVLG